MLYLRGMATATARQKRRAQRQPIREASPQSGIRRLTEYVSSIGTKPIIDTENSVIRGVKVLGQVSKNGRRYTSECVASALPLYEASKINVNHPQGDPRQPRNYEDRIGHLENPRLDGNGDLIGDLHFNPKHRLAEQLVWDAQHAPQHLGLSHNVEAKTRMDGSQVVVDRILNVHGVDLVADPATTNSLFEQDNSPVTGASAGRMPDSNYPMPEAMPQNATNPMQTTTAAELPAGNGKPAASCKEDDEDEPADPAEAICNAYDAKIAELVADRKGDPGENAKQIKDLLVARSKSLQHLAGALGNGDDDEEEDDEDDDDGMEHRRVKKTKGATVVTENAELTRLRSELTALKRKDSARKLLAESNLPPELQTELFLTELTEASAERQKMLINERQMLAEHMHLQRPVSRDEAFTEGFNPTRTSNCPRTSKQLVESLTISRE